jgi:hypothetical protein
LELDPHRQLTRTSRTNYLRRCLCRNGNYPYEDRHDNWRLESDLLAARNGARILAAKMERELLCANNMGQNRTHSQD